MLALALALVLLLLWVLYAGWASLGLSHDQTKFLETTVLGPAPRLHAVHDPGRLAEQHWTHDPPGEVADLGQPLSPPPPDPLQRQQQSSNIREAAGATTADSSPESEELSEMTTTESGLSTSPCAIESSSISYTAGAALSCDSAIDSSSSSAELTSRSLLQPGCNSLLSASPTHSGLVVFGCSR
jgi:hypothetical protein